MPDEEIVITCLSSLEKAIGAASCAFDEATWWRGLADVAWKLAPGVYRDRPSGGKYHEHGLINQFQMRAFGRMGDRPRPWTDLEWLLLAQHYGLPTRLLDWTENPLVALYFAVSDKWQLDKDAWLWALSPTKLNKVESSPDDPSEVQSGLIYPNELVVQAMVMQAFGTKSRTIIEKTGLCSSEMPRVLALASLEMDERIIAQSGRFTIHSCDVPLEDFKQNDRYLRKFLVPASNKVEIRRLLESIGIRRWTVFPDLQSLGDGLKESDFAST